MMSELVPECLAESQSRGALDISRALFAEQGVGLLEQGEAVQRDRVRQDAAVPYPPLICRHAVIESEQGLALAEAFGKADFWGRGVLDKDGHVPDPASETWRDARKLLPRHGLERLRIHRE